jgi:hypothetical protein
MNNVEQVQRFAIRRVSVKKAGFQILNGTYIYGGIYGGAGQYCKKGRFLEEFGTFAIERNSNCWWIKHYADDGGYTDLYQAPVDDRDPDFPPRKGWQEHEADGPPPQISLS